MNKEISGWRTKTFCVILFATVVYLLASCKTAEELTYKAIKKDPVAVAKITRDKWPCIETAKDTVNKIDTLYDWVEVECPPQETDSFITYEAVPYKVKVQTPRIRETREVTIRIKDSATVLICNQELTKSVKTISDLSKKVKRKNKALLWLWITVIGLSLYTFRKPLARALKIPL